MTYLVLLVDTAHERSSGWQDLIDEDEDGFLWRELDALTDDIDKLANCEVCGHQVFLLVDRCDVRFLNFLADHLKQRSDISIPLCEKGRWVLWMTTYWDAVCILLTDSLSFGLALLEWMLVLELGAHVDGSDRRMWM